MKNKWIYVDARRRAFNDLNYTLNERKAVYIDWTRKFTAEEQARADALFPTLLPHLGGYKQDAKRNSWRSIHRALEMAASVKGAVCFPLNYQHKDFSKVRVQVAEATDKAGLAYLVKTPKGAKKMTRLVPRRIKPVARTCFIEMRDRATGEQLELDTGHPVFQRTQQILTLANEVNANWEITIQPYNYSTREDEGRVRIRPIHYRVFTDDFRTHARIYGEHQSHGKRARRSIWFDGQPSVELDYAALHPRMLYHLEGIDYREDPYETAKRGAERVLVKLLINTAINATSTETAINACNNAMNPRTENGQWKTGKAREDAAFFHEAYRRSNATFKQIYASAVEEHPVIAKHFGSDAGIRLLMPLDSKIALRILRHFAKRGVPCLCVHDSFIVPASHGDELKKAMISCYFRELGFAPIVK